MEYRILTVVDADLSDRALNYFKKLKQIDYNDILVLKILKLHLKIIQLNILKLIIIGLQI